MSLKSQAMAALKPVSAPAPAEAEYHLVTAGISQLLARTKAKAKEIAAPAVKWVKVGEESLDGKQTVYAERNGLYVILSPGLEGWFAYMLHADSADKIQSWAKGKTKLLSLTAKVSKEYRKMYKPGVEQARAQELAGAWLVEQS